MKARDLETPRYLKKTAAKEIFLELQFYSNDVITNLPYDVGTAYRADFPGGFLSEGGEVTAQPMGSVAITTVSWLVRLPDDELRRHDPSRICKQPAL